jgi:hypothetical protein
MLIRQLTDEETREMLLDILEASIAAAETSDIDALRNELESWLETAEILIDTRAEADEIMKSREEGRRLARRRTVHGY